MCSQKCEHCTHECARYVGRRTCKLTHHRNFKAFWILLAWDWYYPDHNAAEQAVAKLRDASFDVTKLSIIGKDHTDFLVPGVGPALTAGHLLGALVTGLGSAAMIGGLSALAAALIRLGPPKGDAIKFENAITAGKFLVIARGTPQEVERARLIAGDAFVP